MNPREILDWKLEPALRECRLHERRLVYALGQLAGKLQVTAEQWAAMDDETVADLHTNTRTPLNSMPPT